MNSNKALLKDLELQIDYLVGYTPQGIHWKQEWEVRQQLIDGMLEDESCPQEIKDKITRIQDTLDNMRLGEKHEQSYLNYYSMQTVVAHQIKVTEGGESYYI